MTQRTDRDEKEPGAGSGVCRQMTFLDLLGSPLQVQEQRRIAGQPQPVVLGAVRYEPGGRVDLEYVPKIVSLSFLTQFYDGFTATGPATAGGRGVTRRMGRRSCTFSRLPQERATRPGENARLMKPYRHVLCYVPRVTCRVAGSSPCSRSA